MAEERPPAWLISEDGSPMLRAVHCPACGADLFPAQRYGCIRCGAPGDSLEDTLLAARGTLVSFAVVQTHASHPVPFTLADLQLDAGPVVRAELSAGASPQMGGRFAAVVVEDDRGGHLEFTPEPAR